MIINQTWNDAEIKSARAKRLLGLYPDTVVWGIAINGVHNPTIGVILEEIAKESQSLKAQSDTHATSRS